ncbi:MAG TPA: hypothetical protein VFM28_12210, partial [Nitrososphaeraceae archaeon]|nr:hypothetical protein [Nitrososphaeraceae archaeon]
LPLLTHTTCFDTNSIFKEANPISALTTFFYFFWIHSLIFLSSEGIKTLTILSEKIFNQIKN